MALYRSQKARSKAKVFYPSVAAHGQQARNPVDSPDIRRAPGQWSPFHQFSFETIFLKRLIFALFFIFLFPVLSLAREGAPAFAELAVNNSAKELLLYASLKDAFTEEMTGSLQSGIPLQFHFYAELRERDSGSEAGKWEFVHRLSYDTLQENYRFDNGSSQRFRMIADLAAAKRVMASLNGVPLLKLVALKPATIYTLRLRADLYQRDFPGGAVVRTVMRLWDVKTGWQEFSFTVR